MLEHEKCDIGNVYEKETDVMDVLEKMIELEKERHKVSAIRITVCVVGGIGTLIMMGLLCYRLVKTDFSFESILSTLLAFFSIFISIFFYFKADETSTNFYRSSYDFMKDISVTLGKIEERFGEKLNSINDKIAHLDNISNEKSEEIQEQKEDKDKIINELIDKTNLGEQEKEKYRKQLREKEHQIEKLKQEQYLARRDAELLRSRLIETNGLEDRWEPNNRVLLSLLKGELVDFSPSMAQRLQKLGFLDEEGRINESKILKTLSERGYK